MSEDKLHVAEPYIMYMLNRGFLLLIDFLFLFISFSFFSFFYMFVSSENLISHRDGQDIARLFTESLSKGL